MELILRIEGLRGEFLELSDATPSDQPANLKPRWYLEAEAPLAGSGFVTLTMELWECDPSQLELFLAQLVEAQAYFDGTCFLATGSYPDVNLEVVYKAASDAVDVALEVWDADQKLNMRFQADQSQMEPTVLQLREFIAK